MRIIIKDVAAPMNMFGIVPSKLLQINNLKHSRKIKKPLLAIYKKDSLTTYFSKVMFCGGYNRALNLVIDTVSIVTM